VPRPPLRATDYTLEFVANLLAEQGLLTDDARRTAFARENIQRARLLKASGRGLRRAELTPIELIASFQFTDARREAELIDEDKVAQAVAQAGGLP
jgi:general secretion pathway protein E